MVLIAASVYYISIYFAGVGWQGQQSPNFYGIFLQQVSCNVNFYFYMHICRALLPRVPAFCFYLSFHLFAQVVLRPAGQHVNFILNH